MSATATGLSAAAQNGSKEIIAKLLLTATKDEINWSDGLGNTALIYAAYRGHLECVQLLVKGGADINKVRIENHMTPIMFAAEAGHAEVIKFLLCYWPDLSLKSMGGSTVFDIAKSESIRSLLKSHDAKTTELDTNHRLISQQAAGVQARKDWMQRRDALEAQYEAAEKAINFAECAKLWQDITAHEKLSATLVLTVEDYRTLADRHTKLIASVEARCKELLNAKEFVGLEAVSLLLAEIQAIDAAKLVFPTTAKVSALPPATPTKTSATSSIVSTHTAKQAELASQLQEIQRQHQAILTQAGGVKAREEWTQRRADLQSKFDAAEKANKFLDCAKLGQAITDADAEGTKLALSAEDYRTLGERHVQLVSRHKQLADKHQQAILALCNARKELLAAKDFAGLDAMGQLLTKLQAMSFANLIPPPRVKLPTGFVAASNPPSSNSSESTAPAATPAAVTASSVTTSDVKASYVADPVMTVSKNPVNNNTADPKQKSKKEKCTIM